MKKALFLFALIAFSINAEAYTITVYGKNEGSETTTTTTTNPDGSTTTTTTTTVNCNSFYQDKCYTVEYGIVDGGDILTFGNDPTPVRQGRFISQNPSTNTIVFEE